MKLSAILVSVNLVAALPVAAQAAEDAVSDKAEWLKQNLAAMDTAKKAPIRKISLSDPGMSPRAKVSHLRPFVANRRLPSQRELDLQLVAQQGRMDNSQGTSPLIGQQPLMAQAQSPLAGQVSAYSARETAADPYAGMVSPYTTATSLSTASGRPNRYSAAALAAQRQATRTTPRAIPGQIPTLPGQVAALPGMTPAIPVIPEPQTMASLPSFPQPAPIQTATGSFASQDDRPVEHLVRQGGALLVQAPVLTPDEQSMLDELVELNRPGRASQFQDLPGAEAPPAPSFNAQPRAELHAHTDIGPPPFPLNLLPESALHDLLRRGQRRINAPPAYFGSWHRSMSASALPACGFQSHVHMHGPTSSYFSRYAPIIAQAQTTTGISRRRSRPGRLGARRLAAPSLPQPEPVHIAVYPPYESLSRTSMF